MNGFSINFTHPYLLLILIPVAALLVVAMLRVPKKYRNTRNRVVSVVLESIVVFCAVLILAGMTFTFTTGNTQNEIMLLVDMTDTMGSSAKKRDDYVQSLLYRGEDNSCKMGIVTFGFTQVYAAPLSTDYDNVYKQYKNAALPDTSATDLAAAMQYAAKLFTNPETSKIVIVSDGKETDQSAVSTLTAITAQGTVVESVYIPSEYEGYDIQIVDVEMPEYHVNVEDSFDITLDIQSNYEGDVTLRVTDNDIAIPILDGGGEEDSLKTLKTGSNSVTFSYTVYEKGLHAIRITIDDVDEEVLTQNNRYCVYLYIDNYNRILIFQPEDGQSTELVAALQSKDGGVTEDGTYPYEIKVMTLSADTDDELPTTVDELRQYDLVILNNTSNADMYTGYLNYLSDPNVDRIGEFYSYFYTSTGKEKSGGGLLPQLLYTYVYTYGGGLLTVGGVTEDEDGNYVANMYRRSDMYGTVLQSMLPVTAINYTPPTGVMILIDTSGSMGQGTGSTLEYAILGVLESLDLLSVRDYMGIIEFSSDPHVVMSLTSLMYVSEIRDALNYLKENPQNEGTVMYSSFEMAIALLDDDSSLFERKHIIAVTDGLLADTRDCRGLAQSCNDKGITFSAIVVGGGTTGLANMRELCELADGAENIDDFLYDCSDDDGKKEVGNKIYDDIQSVVWEEINYVDELISVSSSYMFSSLLEGLFVTETDEETGEEITDRNHLNAYISRFYGTTINAGASLILTGDFSVPIYAQWSYGAGTVGSYMGDVHDFGDGTWDTAKPAMILDSDEGTQFIINVVDSLMPTQDIRPNGVTVTLTEDNYTNRINVYADMQDGYTVDAKVYSYDDAENLNPLLNLNEVTAGNTDDMELYVTVALDESNNYARSEFVIKTAGVYKIVVTMYDEDGRVVESEDGTKATATIYKRFSYSAEYDNFNAGDGLELMNALSTGEYGEAFTDAEDFAFIFSGLVTRVSRTVDPRMVLVIIALVLFLLGLAVRKFKWKWIHEIVHDRKERKEDAKEAEAGN